MQTINKINISSNELFINRNNQIDTTGRINEKLITKFNKDDVITFNSEIPESRDNKVYSAAKTDDLISSLDINSYVKKVESDPVFLTNKVNSLYTDGKINVNTDGEQAIYAVNNNMDPTEIIQMNYYNDYIYLVNIH